MIPFLKKPKPKNEIKNEAPEKGSLANVLEKEGFPIYEDEEDGVKTYSYIDYDDEEMKPLVVFYEDGENYKYKEKDGRFKTVTESECIDVLKKITNQVALRDEIEENESYKKFNDFKKILEFFAEKNSRKVETEMDFENASAVCYLLGDGEKKKVIEYRNNKITIAANDEEDEEELEQEEDLIKLANFLLEEFMEYFLADFDISDTVGLPYRNVLVIYITLVIKSLVVRANGCNVKIVNGTALFVILDNNTAFYIDMLPTAQNKYKVFTTDGQKISDSENYRYFSYQISDRIQKRLNRYLFNQD